MRAVLEPRWPRDAEENLERLANAGLPYDRGVIKCRNCGGKSIRTILEIYGAYLIHIQSWVMVPVRASRSARRLRRWRSSAPTAVTLVIVSAIAPRNVATGGHVAIVGKFGSSTWL